MVQSMNILHIEDNQDDALLIRKELQNMGIGIVYKLVDDEQSLKKSLREKEWDIILCDFTMASFSGLDALKIIREFNPNMPVIFVSSTMDEYIILQTIREGANDYVGKNNLAKLIPAIRDRLHLVF